MSSIKDRLQLTQLAFRIYKANLKADWTLGHLYVKTDGVLKLSKGFPGIEGVKSGIRAPINAKWAVSPKTMIGGVTFDLVVFDFPKENYHLVAVYADGKIVNPGGKYDGVNRKHVWFGLKDHPDKWSYELAQTLAQAPEFVTGTSKIWIRKDLLRLPLESKDLAPRFCAECKKALDEIDNL